MQQRESKIKKIPESEDLFRWRFSSKFIFSQAINKDQSLKVNIFLFHERALCRSLAKTTYEALQLIITCLFNVVSLAGFCSGENVSVYYRASGVILNHNFTKEFFTKNCEPCRILADDIKAGVSNDKLLIVLPAAQSKIELNTMNFHSEA